MKHLLATIIALFAASVEARTRGKLPGFKQVFKVAQDAIFEEFDLS
jgi:hypothetical protein